jgi:hypothetical protein
MTTFNAADPSKTVFLSSSSCSITCKLARFDNATCHNTDASTNLYFRVKSGEANLVNSPDNTYTDAIYCFYVSFTMHFTLELFLKPIYLSRQCTNNQKFIDLIFYSCILNYLIFMINEIIPILYFQKLKFSKI